MKQLGSLPKEDRPAAGKLINQAKAELEAVLAARREELELKAALPKEPTDFTLPGTMMRTGGGCFSMTRIWTGEVWVRRRSFGLGATASGFELPAR